MRSRSHVILLLSVFLVGMGLGAFTEAVVSHDAGSIALELPNGSIVPLQSVVKPTEFRKVHVRGWAEVKGNGSHEVEVYYSFLVNGESRTEWKKVKELAVEPGTKKEFEFTIDNETVASVLSSVNVSEATVSVLVSVAPKGKEPAVYVVAGEFNAIDMCKRLNEMAKEEEASAHSDIIEEVAKELGTTPENVKDKLDQHDSTVVKKYAEVKERKRKQITAKAVKYSYDPDKYIRMWCGGDSECVKKVKEALQSNTPKTIPVSSYSICGEIRVGDPSLGIKPSDSYPPAICTKPGKKVLVKRALARRMRSSHSSGEIDTGVNVGGAEREMKAIMASIMSEGIVFGTDVNIDWPTLVMSSILVLAGFVIAGRLRR